MPLTFMRSFNKKKPEEVLTAEEKKAREEGQANHVLDAIDKYFGGSNTKQNTDTPPKETTGTKPKNS